MSSAMHRFARVAHQCAVRGSAAAARLTVVGPSPMAAASASRLHACTAHALAATPTRARRSFSFKAAPSDEDLVQWQNFNTAGLKYLSSGAFEKASLLFMSAMREPVVAQTMYQYLSLSNLGISFRHLGKNDEARSVLLQAIHALKTYSAIHDGMVANLYREAALACEALGQMEEAEGLLNHSLHYYQQHTLAREHAAGAAAASSAAAAATAAAAEQSKLVLETAATHYTLALLIHKGATAAKAVVDGAVTAAANGATAAATAASASSSDAKSSPKHVGVHLRMREAERHYRDALRMMRVVYGTDVASTHSLMTAPVLSSLGTLYSELAEAEQAASHWMEAMTIYQQHQDQRLLPVLDAYMALLQAQDPAYAQLLQQQADEPTAAATK